MKATGRTACSSSLCPDWLWPYSVLSGHLLNMIDDYHLYAILARLEFEPQLLRIAVKKSGGPNSGVATA
jgi:hypothetical protein